MATCTTTQGRYLAFIHAYTTLHGHSPDESEIALALCVSPPSVHQMIKTLERKGLIRRQPGQPRSLEVLLPEDQIPAWNRRAAPSRPVRGESICRDAPAEAAAPARLYVLTVVLTAGPRGEMFPNKEISRTIEIRGDQTLEHLHRAIFRAFDRDEEHLYEFQFGKRPFDPHGARYGIPDGPPRKGTPDVRVTKLDALDLQPGRVFGYWFDFGDDWYHEIRVERVAKAVSTRQYPRVTQRVGKSPPQYPDE